MSNKVGCTPLQSGTVSGDLINEIIIRLDAECYKANLVNFAPIDDKGKIRYPTKPEMDMGYKHLQEYLKEIKPDICVLLGDKVSKYLFNKLDSISIKHPSYISVYKRKYKEEYVTESINLINSIIVKTH